jgi:tetratricopeptide (TPR) repeat protein
MASGDTAAAAEAAVNLGRLLVGDADIDGARAAFDVAIRSGHPHFAPQAAADLGFALAQAGELEAAETAYRTVIESGHPDYGPEAAFNLGVLLARHGHPARARAFYQAAVESGHVQFAAYAANNLGQLRQDAGDLLGARSAFEIALASADPDQRSMAANGLGVLLQLQGEAASAREYYRQAIECGSPHRLAVAAYNLGVLGEEQRRLGDAAAAYRLAMTEGAGELARDAALNLAALRRRDSLLRRLVRCALRGYRRWQWESTFELTGIASLCRELVAYGVTRRARWFVADHPRLVSRPAIACLVSMSKVAKTTGDEFRAEHMKNLAFLLYDTHEFGLDEAYERFLTRNVGSRRAATILLLTYAASEEFEATGGLAALDRAIDTAEKTVELAGADLGTSKAAALNHAGATFYHRFEALGDVEALDKAIHYWERAVQESTDHDSHEHSTASLNYLVYGLRHRYRLTGAASELDRIVALCTELLDRCMDHDAKWIGHVGGLYQLAAALRARHQHGGDGEDMVLAQDLLRRAGDIIDRKADGDSRTFRALAQTMYDLYNSTHDLADLELLLDFDERAVAAATDVTEQTECLHNLGIDARLAFDRTGRLDELNRSVRALEQAAELAPSDYNRLGPLFSSLGNSLRLGFFYLESERDLERALVVQRRSIDVSDEQYRWRLQANLANTLTFSYMLTGELSELDDAIGLNETALRSAPDAEIRSAPWRLQLMDNYAGCLEQRFAQLGDESDLRKALSLRRSALARLAVGSPKRSTHLSNLAETLVRVGEVRGDQAILREATDAFHAACIGLVRYAPAQALEAAQGWGRWAAERQAWDEADRAYGYAVESATRLFRIQSGRDRKDRWLRRSHGVTAEAAYSAARTGDLRKAVMLLESGRAQLLSEALADAHAQLDALAAVGHGELAEAYRNAASQAWVPVDRELASVMPDSVSQRGLTFPPSAGVHLDAVIERIRQVKGFADFLQPWSFHQIADVARRIQPLIYLATTPFGGLALRVGADELVNTEATAVQVRWLPELTSQAIDTQMKEYSQTYSLHGTQPRAFLTGIDHITKWLWPTLMEPLRGWFRATSSTTVICSGWLGLLPLHAAWTDDPTTPTGRRYALDEALLTYSPNARALDAADRRARTVQPESLLVVENSRSSAEVSLPHAAREAQIVAGMFDGPLQLRDTEASVESVLIALRAAQVAHFACHGYADTWEPLNSALLLPNGELLTLDTILSAQLPDTYLIALSACETALQGGTRDEAVSLSTGLLQAGARSVIGSLWRVSDRSTMLLMSRFYQLWKRQGTAPAQAMRLAQQWLRDGTNGQWSTEFPEIAELAPTIDSARLQEAWDSAQPYRHPYHWAAFTYIGR